MDEQVSCHSTTLCHVPFTSECWRDSMNLGCYDLTPLLLALICTWTSISLLPPLILIPLSYFVLRLCLLFAKAWKKTALYVLRCHYVSSTRGCSLVKPFHYTSRNKIAIKIEKIRGATSGWMNRLAVIVLLSAMYILLQSGDGIRWISIVMISPLCFSRSYVHEPVFHYFLP